MAAPPTEINASSNQSACPAGAQFAGGAGRTADHRPMASWWTTSHRHVRAVCNEAERVNQVDIDQGVFVLERVGFVFQGVALQEVIGALGEVLKACMESLLPSLFRERVDAANVCLDAFGDMNEVPGPSAHSPFPSASRQPERICASS